MKNLLITFFQGNENLFTMGSEIMFRSLTKYKDFKKAIVVSKISNRNKKELEKYFDYVYEPQHVIQNYCRDRFIAYYEFLNLHREEFDFVLHIDPADVIIQNNPFDFFKQYKDKELFVVAEGMKVLENECNLWWADLLNKNTFGHEQDYKNSYVLSGGISGGKTSRYIDFCLMIFLNANRINEKIFLDQATLNYLYKYFATDPTVKICHPSTDNFCATGEAIKWKNISVNFKNNKVQTLENQDYYLFHQWDRTEYAPLIKQKENNTFFI